MSLKDLTLSLPRKEVSLADGQSFSVRGLSLSDISILFSFHGERLQALYSNFVSEDEAGNVAISAETVVSFAEQLLLAAPGVAAHIIALAARDTLSEEPQLDKAMLLPLDVQIDALDKAIQLTFQTEGGAKKVWETVARAIRGMGNFSGPNPRV